MRIIIFVLCLVFVANAQQLKLPVRSVNAMSGSQFSASISSASLSFTNRENLIYAQISTGNVPNFFRALKPVTSSGKVSGVTKTVTYYVIPDYLAIGHDTDYFLCPMSPMIATKIGQVTGCILPTRKMVNDIWTAATVKLAPSAIPASSAMTTVPVFIQHNTTVKGQRQAVVAAHPLGELVSGDKKDVVISNQIYTTANRVVIYGWHYTSGTAIQPLSNVHTDTYYDYSHGIRLIQDSVLYNGSATTCTAILQSATLYPLLSDEGKIAKPYYPYLVTGIQDLEANVFSIYPNPSNGSIYLFSDKSLQDIPFKIVDLSGKDVLKGQINNAFIQASELAPGYYFLIIDNNSHPISIQ